MKSEKTFVSQHSGLITKILLGVGFVLTGSFLLLLPPMERTLVNILSVIGTTASFFGLAVAFIQIIALKEISEITQITINETKTKLKLGISISDVAETIKLISEIDTFIGNQKYEIGRFKLIDLRDKLLQFKSSEGFKEILEVEQLQEIIDLLNVQISTLYFVVYSEEDIKYDPESIINQIQEISTYLSDFRNNIKYQTV